MNRRKRRAKSSPSNQTKGKKKCQISLDRFISLSNVRRELEQELDDIDVEEDELANDKQNKQETSIYSEKDTGNTIMYSGTDAGNEIVQMEPTQDNTRVNGLNAQLQSHGELLQQILQNQEKSQSCLTNLETRMSALESSIRSQGNALQQLEQRIVTLESNPSQCQTSYPNEVSQLVEQVNRIERKQRERNVRLIGLQEQHGENCKAIVESIIRGELRLNAYVEVAHRTGRKTDRPRHVIFRLSSVQEKIDVLKAQRHSTLRSNIHFIEDLTHKDYETKKAFRPQIMKARSENKRWQFRNGELYIEGRKVQLQDEMVQQHYTQSGTTYADALYGAGAGGTNIQNPINSHVDITYSRSNPNHEPPSQGMHGGTLKTRPQYVNTQQVHTGQNSTIIHAEVHAPPYLHEPDNNMEVQDNAYSQMSGSNHSLASGELHHEIRPASNQYDRRSGPKRQAETVQYHVSPPLNSGPRMRGQTPLLTHAPHAPPSALPPPVTPRPPRVQTPRPPRSHTPVQHYHTPQQSLPRPQLPPRLQHSAPQASNSQASPPLQQRSASGYG